MPLTFTITKPPLAGGRADDYRAFKRRVRRLTSAGTYAAGGAVVTAREVGLKKIVAVNLLNGHLAVASTPTTGEAVSVVVGADGLSATFRLNESAAAGSPFAEKGAEAVLTGQVIDAEFIGY
jgi:hypothetical protein